MRDWPWSTRAAAVLLGVALAVDVGAMSHAQRLHSVEAADPLAIPSAPRIIIVTAADAELIHTAANRTPFDIAEPTPATISSGALARQVAPPAPVRPRLVGTVVQPQGGFVVLELPDMRMHVVRIGEQAAGLRLRTVTAGEAVFDDSHGARVSLRTSPTGAESRP